jgi:hypothetical protein
LSIVAEKVADGQASTGRNIMTEIIAANPELRGVFASNPVMARGAGQALVVWSRSVGESAKLIPHSGRDYGPGTSRLRHDHARRPNCDTAIEGSAQGTSGAAWAEPQDSCQVA